MARSDWRQVGEAMASQLSSMVLECYETEELMVEYERLYGERPRLDKAKSPLEFMIDTATGYSGFQQSPEWERFIQFVFRSVFVPLKTAQVREAAMDYADTHYPKTSDEK